MASPGRPRKDGSPAQPREKRTPSRSPKLAKTRDPAIYAPRPAEPRPDRVGRPRIVIDWDLVEKLSAIGCTQEEIGAIVGCSAATLNTNQASNARFLEIVKTGRAKFKASIRRQQYKLLMDGNPAAAIWLGKSELGQTERREIDARIEVGRDREIAVRAFERDDRLLDRIYGESDGGDGVGD